MKKKYFAPQIKAHKVQIPTILTGSETIKVDDSKTTPSMLSKSVTDIENLDDDEY